MAGNRFPRDSDCRAKNAACAGIKYPTPQPRPVIKYKLHRREERDRGRGGGKDEERKKEGRGGEAKETKRVRNERRRSGGNTILRLAVFHENLRPR